MQQPIDHHKHSFIFQLPRDPKRKPGFKKDNLTLFGRQLHIGLFLTMLIVLGIGFTVIYSASVSKFGHLPSPPLNLAYKQIIFACVSLVVAFMIFMVDVRLIYRITWPGYWASILLLIAVFVIGKSSHGATRWISLGFMDIQPSELAKITIILALAKYMRNHVAQKSQLVYIVFPFLILCPPLLLIIKQPDLGTALTLIPTATFMLFVGGIRLRYFLAILPLATIPLLIIGLAKFGVINVDDLRNLLFFLKPYQQNRLLVFVDPNIDPQGLSYNLIQSIIAIGSGGVFGKGFLAGTQTHLKFLPERHTDFIFSVLGEEWGLMGAITLLFLYTLIILFGLRIATQCNDFFLKLASVGVVMLLLSHIFTNIGMTIGLMPITGLPLPLLSYGGSSLMTMMVALGLLLNFYSNRNISLKI